MLNHYDRAIDEGRDNRDLYSLHGQNGQVLCRVKKCISERVSEGTIPNRSQKVVSAKTVEKMFTSKTTSQS